MAVNSNKVFWEHKHNKTVGITLFRGLWSHTYPFVFRKVSQKKYFFIKNMKYFTLDLDLQGFASIAHQHLGQRLRFKHVATPPSSGEDAAGPSMDIRAEITACFGSCGY